MHSYSSSVYPCLRSLYEFIGCEKWMQCGCWTTLRFSISLCISKLWSPLRRRFVLSEISDVSSATHIHLNEWNLRYGRVWGCLIGSRMGLSLRHGYWSGRRLIERSIFMNPSFLSDNCHVSCQRCSLRHWNLEGDGDGTGALLSSSISRCFTAP